MEARNGNRFQNSAIGFQRPGLSYATGGGYAGYNPLFAGVQTAPSRGADWNWISMQFNSLQSSIQQGGSVNLSGQTLQNPRIFGLILPDMTPGSVLFVGPASAVSQNNGSFFWDNTNLVLKDAGQFRVGTSTDTTVAGEFAAGSSTATFAMWFATNITTLNAQNSPAVGIGVSRSTVTTNLGGNGWGLLNLYTTSEDTNNIFGELNSTIANGFNFRGRMSRPTTLTTLTGDVLGSFYGEGYTSAVTPVSHPAGVMQIVQDGNATATGVPGQLMLFAYTGTGTAQQLVTLRASGLIGLNTGTPRQRVDILDGANPQLRLTFTDNTVYTDFKTDSGGILNILPSGNTAKVGTTITFMPVVSGSATPTNNYILANAGGTGAGGVGVTGTNYPSIFLANTANANGGQVVLESSTATWALYAQGSQLRFNDGTADRPLLMDTGNKIGFYGHAPVVRTAAYTVTNPVSNRSFDTTTVTTQQLAQVVGTMLADLQGNGLFQ